MIKVLHVDDDPIDHSLFSYNLKSVSGEFEILSADCANEALVAIESQNYDCIISDFQMPGLNGIELLSIIRHKEIGIPFIFLTGQGNEKLAAEALRSGADDYFTKELGFAHYERLAASINRNVESYLKEKKLKDAQIKLDLSRKRFVELFNQAPISISIYDKEGWLIDINTCGKEIYQISGEDAIGKYNLFSSYSLKENDLMPYIKSCYQGNKVHLPVYEYDPSKDIGTGKKIFQDTLMYPIRENGEVIGIVIIVQDVTSKIEAEENRKRSEERLAILLEHAGDAIFVSDLQGNIVQVNQQACNNTGYTREELLTMTVMDVSEQLSTPGQLAAFYGSMDFQKPVNVSAVHKRKDGTTYIAESTISKISTPEGVQFFSLVRDITFETRRKQILNAHYELFKKSAHIDVKTLLQEFLDYAEKFTESNIGFFHFVEDDQENLSLQTWSTNTLQNMCTAEGAGQHYPISMAGVWVDCIKTGEPVVHNDYESLANKKGLPPGHAPVLRELVVPVVRGDKIVAILGVGNKPSFYNDFDVDTVQQFADSVWEIVNSKRTEEKLLKLLGEKNK